MTPLKGECYLTNKIKYLFIEGKIRPRTGHEGPEEEKRYSSTLS
jgi:hypothetical protein